MEKKILETLDGVAFPKSIIPQPDDISDRIKRSGTNTQDPYPFFQKWSAITTIPSLYMRNHGSLIIF